MKVYLRDPNAYTPLINPQIIKGQKVTSLILGRDAVKTQEQIAQFSERDAQVSRDDWGVSPPPLLPRPMNTAYHLVLV